MIMNKKMQLRKAVVIAMSASFVLFNTAVSYAQTTTPSTTDTTTDTMTDTTTDSTDPTTEDTTVIDVIENTGSEEVVDQPEEDSGDSGGGGGGGAILGLIVVGAVVAVVLSSKKSPKIQKTLVSDKVSGYGTQFVELSSKSSFIEGSTIPKTPQLSFQYGSYQQVAGFNKPYSFFNVRASHAIGANLNFHADAGTKLSFNNGLYSNDSDVANSQWFVFGLQTINVLRQNDRLEFFAKYSTGDNDQQDNKLLSNGADLHGYESLFSDENARFELAYSRSLSQNQRLRFLLQKTDSLSEEDDDYRAKIAWRHAF